jgi:hypothetical protein
MSHEVGGTPEPAEDELALERAIDQTVNQTEIAGDGERDNAQLQAALRGLISSAEHWERVGDLHPYIGVFRDFGLSVLSQLIDNLPQHQHFREWLPQNWIDKPELNLGMALQVINEGVPLIWVPRASIVSDLLRARHSEVRSRILVDRHIEISRNCLTVLGEVSHPELTELAEFAVEATQALGDARYRSAQALAGNILDTWMRDAARRGVFGNLTGWIKYKQVRAGIRPFSNDTSLEFFREICALAPVTKALEHHNPDDPPPTIFNRHATAHNVGQEQYSPANAVISVMLISSVLREAEESGL